MKTIIALLFISLFAPAVNADKVDDFVQAEMKRHQTPGFSLAVLKNGKVLKSKGYGFANIEIKAPATPETVYQLASITKCFTATAVMILVEDGKLELADKITAHLLGLPTAWSNVTVRHLLTHTSGIKSYTQLDAIALNPQKDIKSEEMIALVADLPLEFPPGDRYDYSNTGYFILGLLIEKLSGVTYGDFLDHRLFKPAGMTQTRVNNLGTLFQRTLALS
jgi:D-alanyl-D-alanine carboxypeptidase